MNIKILDSWLREHVTTKATPKQIAEKLSLSSVSVERIEKFGSDFVYDIEITTNRPDLMSLVGLARETATVLSENGIHATFVSPKLTQPKIVKTDTSITIKNDPKLVNRVMAVIMEVNVKPSPKEIKDRLESSDIRSLNSLIDVTNYVMRVIGHPTHVFDFDRLNTKTLKIREAKKNEEVVTLDKKTHVLQGGDIVAENDKGEIVDLLGVMGLENSVVTDKTKRILFFIDNNDPVRMRKTSMSLGIRSEAAVINEKGIDPELAEDAMLYGISMFEKIADGKAISEIIDIYPNKPKIKSVTVSEEKIQSVIGVDITLKKSAEILTSLGFEVKTENSRLTAKPPSFRVNEIEIPEDLIEEIARIYGYHNIPNSIPPLESETISTQQSDQFYWENKVKDALMYWGFTEVYTYPMVSEELFEGDLDTAVTIQNPLGEDMVYMRRTLVPSLLQVIRKNKNYDKVKIFEIANVYLKRENNLPNEFMKLAAIIKKPKVNFYEAKGIIEQLLFILGIKDLEFKEFAQGGDGASVYLKNEYVGDIEILDDQTIDFELNLELILKNATHHKTYKPLSKYPPSVEDLAIVAPTNVLTGEIMNLIKKQSDLIREVNLLDKYQDTRTFHIVYQSYQKNLTSEEVGDIREKILKALKEKFGARQKE